MGHQDQHHDIHGDHHHHAVDGLVTLFTKANNDLIVVHNLLDKDFRQIYPDNDLIDKARTTIDGNRASLERLQTFMGIPVTSDSGDPA